MDRDVPVFMGTYLFSISLILRVLRNWSKPQAEGQLLVGWRLTRRCTSENWLESWVASMRLTVFQGTIDSCWLYLVTLISPLHTYRRYW